MSADRFVEVIEMAQFHRVIRKLIDEDDVQALVWTLAQNPKVGVVMPRTGGFRKMRLALGGRGKSGSARVIYYFIDARDRVYLVHAYAKNEQENLTREQENEFRKLAALLDTED